MPEARKLLSGHTYPFLIVGDIEVCAVFVPEEHFFTDHGRTDAPPVLPRIIENRLAARNIKFVTMLVAERVPQAHHVVNTSDVKLVFFIYI